MALLDVFLTRNPMLFTYSAPADWATLDNYRFYMAVEIYNGTTWVPALVQEQIPNSLNQVKFDVKAAFRQAFNPAPPIPGASSITRAINKTAVLFRLKYGNLTGALTVPLTVTTDSDYLAVMGGVTKPKFAELGHFFFTFLNGSNPKRFMSWAPKEKMVDRNQEDWISFWLTSAPAGNVFHLQLTAYYDDGTNQTSNVRSSPTINFADPADRLWAIPIGPSNTGALGINTSKNLLRYIARLVNGSNTAISEERTFVIDPVSYPNKKLIMFYNSLGSHEVLRFSGNSSSEEKYDRQVSKKYLAPGYSATDGELKSSGAQGTNMLNLSSGWFEGRYGKEWQEYMRDLMKSRLVFDVSQGTRVPLVISSGSLNGPEDRNYRYFARFEAMEAFTEEVYTPASIV